MSNVLVVAEVVEGKIRKATLQRGHVREGGRQGGRLVRNSWSWGLAPRGGCGGHGPGGVEGGRRRRRVARSPGLRAVRADRRGRREGGLVRRRRGDGQLVRQGHRAARGRQAWGGIRARMSAVCKTDGGGKLTFRRPMYAGNAYAFCEVTTPVKVVSVRQSEFAAAEPSGGSSAVETAALAPADAAASRVQFVSLEAGKSERPDLGEASVIVSGGRALKEKFAQVSSGPSGNPARRRRRCEPSRVRCRLCACRAAGWSDRSDRRAEALLRHRHLGGHPAPRRHEGVEDHRGGQQRPGGPHLPGRRLRPRGRPVRR